MSILLLRCITIVCRIAHLPKYSMSVGLLVNTADSTANIHARNFSLLVRDSAAERLKPSIGKRSGRSDCPAVVIVGGERWRAARFYSVTAVTRVRIRWWFRARCSGIG